MRASTFLSISALPFAVVLSLAQKPAAIELETMPVQAADAMFRQYPAWAKRMKIAEMAKTSNAKSYAWACDDHAGAVECRAVPLQP
jgi:hypothetical protein